MRPYILSECNWKDLKTAFELAVLPWGATEAHNYHLPYGTDVYEANAIAAESGKKHGKKGQSGHFTHHSLWGQYRPERYLFGYEHESIHPNGSAQRCFDSA